MTDQTPDAAREADKKRIAEYVESLIAPDGGLWEACAPRRAWSPFSGRFGLRRHNDSWCRWPARVAGGRPRPHRTVGSGVAAHPHLLNRPQHKPTLYRFDPNWRTIHPFGIRDGRALDFPQRRSHSSSPVLAVSCIFLTMGALD